MSIQDALVIQAYARPTHHIVQIVKLGNHELVVKVIRSAPKQDIFLWSIADWRAFIKGELG